MVRLEKNDALVSFEEFNISKSEKQGQAMRGDIFGVRGVGGLQILQSKLQYL
jgi:hypothetical protein